MFETSARRHGLEAFMSALPVPDPGYPGLKISMLDGLGHINLRGDADDEEFRTIVAAVLGQPLPTYANSWWQQEHRVVWLGPDEWLILSAAEYTKHLLARLNEALSKKHVAINDLSGGLVTLHLAGQHVRDVLAKGCTLDLHPAEFKDGTCAQSGLAKANVLLAYVEAPSAFDLTVRRSFSDYLVRWLLRAGREYGIEFD